MTYYIVKGVHKLFKNPVAITLWHVKRLYGHPLHIFNSEKKNELKYTEGIPYPSTVEKETYLILQAPANLLDCLMFYGMTIRSNGNVYDGG